MHHGFNGSVFIKREKLDEITIDREGRIRSNAWQTAARFPTNANLGLLSPRGLTSAVSFRLSNNAEHRPPPTMGFHLHLWAMRRAVRVVTLLDGGKCERDGQRRSLKIESICAPGLEIQIRREISTDAPVDRRRDSLSSYNPSIYPSNVDLLARRRRLLHGSVGSI